MDFKLNEVRTFKFLNREENITGYILSFKDDWVCIHINNVDLSFDGVMYFQKGLVEDVFNTEDDKFLNKIYQARSLNIPNEFYNFNLTLNNILAFSLKNNEIVQLETDEEDVCYIGLLKIIKEKEVIIQTITSSAKLDELDVYKLNEIQFIELQNDYIESLKSVMVK